MSDAFLCLGFCFSFLSSLDDDIHLRVFLYLVGGGCSMLSSSLFRLAVPEIANISLMSSEAETVRWFLYPQEAAWHNAYPDTSTIMRRSPFIVVSRQDGATTQVRWLRGTVFDLNGYLLVGSKKKKKLANYFTKQYSLHW
eukprot:m.213012 g.213012  ORF g.213012 m.213012 type:complete len:140 (-) comp16952_c0_seq12:2915-3334(-)